MVSREPTDVGRLSPKAVAALEVVTTNPGCTAADLLARVPMKRSTSCHVLVELEDAGLVYRRPGGFIGVRRQYNRWYPVSDPEATDRTSGAPDPASRGGEAEAEAVEVVVPSRDDSAARPLRRGELHGLVLDHLRAHPEEALSPTQVCRALNRSAGATANALTALCNGGLVVLVDVKPKTYQLAPPVGR
jgi:hypothetical protein